MEIKKEGRKEEDKEGGREEVRKEEEGGKERVKGKEERRQERVSKSLFLHQWVKFLCFI